MLEPSPRHTTRVVPFSSQAARTTQREKGLVDESIDRAETHPLSTLPPLCNSCGVCFRFVTRFSFY